MSSPPNWMDGWAEGTRGPTASSAPSYNCIARNTCPPIDADSTIKVLARAIVRSQKQCLAYAMNSIFIEILHARNVRLEDVQIMQRASSTARCSQSIDVDMGSLQFEIKQALEESMVGGGDQETKTTMINDISQSFGDVSVNACVGVAVNDFRITAAQRDDVNISDVTIDQLAETNITNCLQRGVFRIGDVPMRDYIDRQVQKMPGTRLLRLPGACPDPKSLNKYYMIAFGVAGTILLVALLLAILL